jgi:hypothetical protein
VDENTDILSDEDHIQQRHIEEHMVEVYGGYVLVCVQKQCSQRLLGAGLV